MPAALNVVRKGAAGDQDPAVAAAATDALTTATAPGLWECPIHGRLEWCRRLEAGPREERGVLVADTWDFLDQALNCAVVL